MVDPVPTPLSGPANPSLHILILDPAFQDGARPGPTAMLDLATRLVSAGHRVTALAPHWDSAGEAPAGIAVRAPRRPPADAGTWNPSPATLAAYGRWAAFQMWQVPEVDVVLAAAAPTALLPVIAAFAWWRAIPFIATARDLPPDPPPPTATRREQIMAWIAHRARKTALLLPRRIFATSQAVMAALTTDGARAQLVQTMYGCDTRLFAVPAGRDNHFLREFPDLAGRPLIVFSGRFTADRDLVAVINLATALREWAPDTTVILCGDGPARESLAEHARNVGVLDNAVRIIGPLPRRELPDLLAAATMVLSVPRNNDTAGGFFDALAAGRPILAFGDSWQRSLVESRGAGFGLPAGDPRAVAREVTEILRDADGLRRAGQQAAALAASRFNLDRIVGDQRAVIEALVSEAPRAEVLRVRTLRAKRITDVIVALAGLILLSPLWIVVSVLIAFKLGWPVIRAGERTGLKGRAFRCLRFRTMTDAEDAGGGLLPEDERATSFGHFIDKSGLSALPQLLNVVWGTMSLVGPPPLPTTYLPYYTPAQRRRHDLRPGITGLSQIEAATASSWEDIFTLDVAYVDTVSIGLDWKILFKTAVLLIRGARVSPRETLPSFDEIMARREGAEDV